MKKTKKTFISLFIISISAILLSGCILSLIPIPEIKTSVKVFSASIPASSFEQWVNSQEHPIGKVCSSTDFNIETLRQKAIEEIQKLNFSPWLTRILTSAVEKLQLKYVMVKKITLKATNGDFSTISKLSAKIKINNSQEEINLGEGKITDDKKEIIFNKEIEALEYLNKTSSEQTCIEGTLIITGTLGTQAINFDAIFDLSIKITL